MVDARMYIMVEFIHVSLSILVALNLVLLYPGSEERRVLGVGSIPVAILPSC